MIKRTIKVYYPIYKIVENGSISSQTIGEGRFIPALIIDTGTDKEIHELIQLHKEVYPGDTELQWSLQKTIFTPKLAYLNIKVIRPMKLEFGIEFELASQYLLIDGIIQSRAFYLATGKASDKVSEKMANSIIVEVPNLDFDKKWNEILNKMLKKKYRDEGASKKEAQKEAMEYIKSMREVWNLRRLQ